MTVAAVPAEPATQSVPWPLLKEADTRFLLPFSFQRRTLDKAVRALQGLTVDRRALPAGNAGGVAEKISVWAHRDVDHVHEDYVDEATAGLRTFLFHKGSTHGANLNGAYLRLEDRIAEAWFGNSPKSVSFERDGEPLATFPVHLVPESGIELFLSGHGIGVLSIDLRPVPERLDAGQMLLFNYQLAQFRRTPPAQPRFSSPPVVAVTSRGQGGGASLGADAAPFIERPVGRDGESFTLEELASALLEPLEPLGMHWTQDSLVVYTTMRLSAPATFSPGSPGYETLAEVVGAAAQVHEPGHPGGSSQPVETAGTVLTRSHWAAGALQGAAHLCADQGIAFDDERPVRIRFKYFAVFVAALMQRTFVAHKSVQTAALAAETEIDEELLGELRSSVLQFSLTGNVLAASTRSVVQHYYRLCQETQGVERGLKRIRRALSDLHETQLTRGLHKIERSVLVVAVLTLAVAVLTLWLDYRKS